MVHVAQVGVFVDALKELESKLKLKKGELRLELMIENPQSLFDFNGCMSIRKLVDAAQGRCL